MVLIMVEEPCGRGHLYEVTDVEVGDLYAGADRDAAAQAWADGRVEGREVYVDAWHQEGAETQTSCDPETAAVLDDARRLLPPSSAQAAYDELTPEQKTVLLDKLFHVLEYDGDGVPGVEWNDRVWEGITAVFEANGVRFTDANA